MEVFHLDGEPDNANRIRIIHKDLEVEVLPSKGFSIGQVHMGGIPVLWDPPTGLVDPDKTDFSGDDICINGQQAPGFEYLKSYMGGIEFLGLVNWGMPGEDPVSGTLLPLHGEVSNIPLRSVAFEVSEDGLSASGTFMYRTMEGEPRQPWYERGEALYRVTKTLVMKRSVAGFTLLDTITNVSNRPLVPDWGYHVTFRPEAGSRLLVPSLKLEERGGGTVPGDHDTWSPARDESVRTEIGIIHKAIKPVHRDGTTAAGILKVYPDGRAIGLTVPLTPYFQTWFSSGGAGSDEFTLLDGTRLYSKSWNGFGVEIGSSPLDHNGNIDHAVPTSDTLEPGERTEIRISLELLDGPEAKRQMNEIESYNAGRK